MSHSGAPPCHCGHASQYHSLGERGEHHPQYKAIEGFVRGKSEVKMSDIFKIPLNLTATADWSRGEQMRVGRVMTSLGWIRKRVRNGPHRLEWKYVPLRGLVGADNVIEREAEDNADDPAFDLR